MIGNGLNTFGDITSISWGDNAYYLKFGNGSRGGNNFSITATTQLLSVPYALYANEAGSAPGTQGPAGPKGLTGPKVPLEQTEQMEHKVLQEQMDKTEHKVLPGPQGPQGGQDGTQAPRLAGPQGQGLTEPKALKD